jgi:hypothetical protein
MLNYNSRSRVDGTIYQIDSVIFENDGCSSLDEFRLNITQVLSDAAREDVLSGCYRNGYANYNYWTETDLICMIADELITHSYESA